MRGHLTPHSTPGENVDLDSPAAKTKEQRFAYIKRSPFARGKYINEENVI